VDRTDVYFGDIVKGKTEELPDGTIMVYGKAAGPDLDLDQQRCDPAWLKKEMPEWMTFGNVREQHGAVAAGVGKALTGQGDDWYLKAHVVDPVTVLKVKTGVLKGFSIGIRDYRTVVDATAPKGRIVAGFIPEISLVDRPSNPTAVMSIAKAAGSALAPVDQAGVVIALDGVDVGDVAKAATADPYAWVDELDDTVKAAIAERLDKAAAFVGAKARRKMAKQGVAMPDGSFPIPDASHLDSAIKLAGNAHDPAAARAHIRKRAAALGLSAKIPDSWSGDSGGDTDKSATVDASKATTGPTGSDRGLLTADTVKALIAEATAERDAKIEALTQRLDKALAAPAPGGPVILAPSTGANPQVSQAQSDLAKAAGYRATAARTNDPGVAAAYLREAAKLESAAT
jgi:hypothetical protein